MELLGISYFFFAVELMQVINYKINYFNHEAICLDYHSSNRTFTTYPLYEYEIIEAGIKTVYKNSGVACFRPKKGKKYRVLIRKDNYNKIVGYSEYIMCIVETCLLIAVILFEMNSYINF